MTAPGPQDWSGAAKLRSVTFMRCGAKTLSRLCYLRFICLMYIQYSTDEKGKEKKIFPFSCYLFGSCCNRQWRDMTQLLLLSLSIGGREGKGCGGREGGGGRGEGGCGVNLELNIIAMLGMQIHCSSLSPAAIYHY